MDLNSFFDPVSLKKPHTYYLPENERFCSGIEIHTKNNPIQQIEKFDVVIIGVPESSGSVNETSDLAPDHIRESLYQMTKISNLRLFDLGNLKTNGNINNSIAALREVLIEMGDRGIISIIIGGSHQLTQSIYDCHLYLKKKLNLCVLDAKIDIGSNSSELTADNYLLNIFNTDIEHRILESFGIYGYQSYYTYAKQFEMLDNLSYEYTRLGQIRGQLDLMEPILRDSNAISIDVNCIRQQEFPANYRASCNGFYGEEICQIARYSALSDYLLIFGLFETNPVFDVNYQSSQLASHIVWYFLESLSQRNIESKSTLKKFYVPINNKMTEQIIFYKSEVTGRWWFEIPEKQTINRLYSCSYSDYQKASNNELPKKWWQIVQKK